MKLLKTLFRELLLGLLLAVLLWAIDRSLNFAEYDTGRTSSWKWWTPRFITAVVIILLALIALSLKG